MIMTTYSYTDDLSEVFVGRRIVKAEGDVPAPNIDGWFSGTPPYGRLTLDDGTKVYVVGNEGGCICSAGDYSLARVAAVDNIITAVKVIDESTGDGSEDYATRRYQIFVVTEAGELNVAEFVGDDGNGYYGSGFHLAVVGVAA
jgi:hypothetical protein